MYVLIASNGSAYRTVDNLPVVVPNLDSVQPELKENALEVSDEEAKFLLRNAAQAVYDWRYLPLESLLN